MPLAAPSYWKHDLETEWAENEVLAPVYQFGIAKQWVIVISFYLSCWYNLSIQCVFGDKNTKCH